MSNSEWRWWSRVIAAAAAAYRQSSALVCYGSMNQATMNKYTHIETQRDNTITSNCEYNQHSFVLPAVLPLYLLLRTLCDLLFVCVHADTQLAKPKPSHHYCPKPLTQSLALQCHQSTCKWTTTGTAAAGNGSVSQQRQQANTDKTNLC